MKNLNGLGYDNSEGQYCINKNHNYKRVRGGIEVLY